jgi:DNA-damage-inducible protein J
MRYMLLAYDMLQPFAARRPPMATEMLHVRLDGKIKERASAALETMGLTVSEAVRVFLHRVAVEQAIPFAIKVPNAATRAAMGEARDLSHARYATSGALFDALSAEGE